MPLFSFPNLTFPLHILRPGIVQLGLGLPGTFFPFSAQIFQNTVSCHHLWEGISHPLHPIPSWVGCLADSILLIPVDFLFCVMIVCLSDIYIRGRKCVLSSVFPGHNTMHTCTSPSINKIWVMSWPEQVCKKLWCGCGGVREVWLYVNSVAYQLFRSLELAPR